MISFGGGILHKVHQIVDAGLFSVILMKTLHGAQPSGAQVLG
jgi:hypothetical protein